jgi:hypothetical protein
VKMEALSIGAIDQIVPPSSLEAAAITECERWMTPPGRQASKILLRSETLARWQQGKVEESKRFVDDVTNPKVQAMIKSYIASLGNKAK